MPGSDTHLDKKGYEWELIYYSETQIKIRFTFDNPLFISAGAVDTMKIEYYNAQVWAMPLNS